MAKKANGEGTIYRRKVDGMYVGSITLEDGKRKYFYSKKRQEVHQKMQNALREKKEGTLVTAPQQTLSQYLTYWLENNVKDSVRPRTYERYEQYVRLHIVPIIGKVKLQALTPQQVQSLKSKKLKEGLSSTTVGTILIVLHKSLSDAVRLGLVTRNVCDMVQAPRKQHKEMKTLTSDEAKRLLDAAEGHANEALFVLALATGMRRGELLGLKWQDIDSAHSVLYVRRVLNRTPTIMGEGAGSLVEAEPKTRQSRRSIVLATFAIDALQKHRVLQEEQRKVAGDAWENHDYIFCTALGRGIHPNTLQHQFRALLEKAGLPAIRFHDLRHSVATLLLSRGVHPKVVQEILGHSQIGITMDVYSHVLPTMHEDAMSELNQAFARSNEEEKSGDGDDDHEGLTGVGVPRRPKRK